MTEKKQLITAPTRNWRFSASYDSFVVAQKFVLRMNISALRGVRHDHPDRRAWCFHQAHTAE